jgi:pimeloyl-ACP methyl ester carboxylesterase
VQFPTKLRETFIANAPTFLDEARDPEALRIDLDRLRAFTAPALLTVGDTSPPFYPLVVNQVARALPQVTRGRFSGGHVPHVTVPAEYVKTVTSFTGEAT